MRHIEGRESDQVPFTISTHEHAYYFFSLFSFYVNFLSGCYQEQHINLTRERIPFDANTGLEYLGFISSGTYFVGERLAA